MAKLMSLRWHAGLLVTTSAVVLAGKSVSRNVADTRYQVPASSVATNPLPLDGRQVAGESAHHHKVLDSPLRLARGVEPQSAFGASPLMLMQVSDFANYTQMIGQLESPVGSAWRSRGTGAKSGLEVSPSLDEDRGSLSTVSSPSSPPHVPIARLVNQPSSPPSPMDTILASDVLDSLSSSADQALSFSNASSDGQKPQGNRNSSAYTYDLFVEGPSTMHVPPNSTTSEPLNHQAAPTVHSPLTLARPDLPRQPTLPSQPAQRLVCSTTQRVTAASGEVDEREEPGQVAMLAVSGTILNAIRNVPWMNIGCALALVLGITPPLCAAAIVTSLYRESNQLRRKSERKDDSQAKASARAKVDPKAEDETEIDTEDQLAETEVQLAEPEAELEVGARLVYSPYSGQREAQPQLTVLILQLSRLFLVCVPSPFCRQAWYLANSVLLAFLDGLLECLVPILIVRPLWQMVQDNELGQFQAFAAFMMCYNALISIVKSTANYNAMLAMISCREELVMHLHRLYLCTNGRPYYTLSNLDNRVDAPDARITNDTDLLMQFLFEFIFGGIMKPEAGMCSQVFFLVATLGLAYSETERKATGWGFTAIGIALSVVVVSLVPTLVATKSLTKAQAHVQACEARHRSAYAKCRLFAESVCFYAGEDTEAQQLDARFEEVRAAFRLFAVNKLSVDLIQLSFYFGVSPIASLIAAFIVRKGEWTHESQTTFYVLNLAFVRVIRCCMEISKNIVDLAKAKAMLRRIIHLLEVMEAFVAFDAHAGSPVKEEERSLVKEEEQFCCVPYYRVRELRSSEVVPVQPSDGILFEHVDVYTPDGLRLLLQDVNLRLAPSESCLIMGPSGIGKSSLLRVLGQLWPLFRSPGEAGRRARFCRPGARNLFFLAQRPYLFEGTLREQLAYPLWENELLLDLTNDCMERLFKEANLGDVWEARKDELDKPGISWCNVLSLGEQQRLQFCRLFWHAEWHRLYGNDSQGFFAVLDESSASMDTASEMIVYQACRKRNIGFLSVAHRPTVIQFHTKVLQFEFDGDRKLQCTVRDGREMALESVHLITNEGNNNTELRARNPRRSISSSSLCMNTLRKVDRSDKVCALAQRSCSVMSLSSFVTNAGSAHSLEELACRVTHQQGIRENEVENHAALSVDEECPVMLDDVGEGHSDALVLSPYSEKPEKDTQLGTLGSLWRLTLICHNHGLQLFTIIVLNLSAAVLLSAWSFVFVNLKSIMRPGKQVEFQALGHGIGICVSYESMWPVVLMLGPVQGIVKALANYLTVLLMIDWRTRLHMRLQAMYLSKEARLYYTLNCLDMRVDSADQRITNDVDLMMQFLFEFFFGGVMKPDSGVLFKGSVFMVSCWIMWMEVESVSPGQGCVAPGIAFCLFSATFLLVERLGRRCGEAQEELQASEGAFRAAHARCQTFAEGISFYGGESTERVMLDGHYKPVVANFLTFAWRKFPMEVLQLMFYQGQFTMAMLLGGVVAFRTERVSERTRLFDLTNSAMVSCLMALNKITCQAMDFAKGCALSTRVSQLYEVMETFLFYELTRGATHAGRGDFQQNGKDRPLINTDAIGMCCPYEVKKLPCGALVQMEHSDAVVLEHVDVYTPDGLRLLLEDVNLRLNKGDRCLIMGPSGIGKSSLVRVLGQLWPLFRRPGPAGRLARFCRPGPMNVFFLAQRPYLFEGTLRQQVAYPVWNQSLIEELNDGMMAELFKDANLTDVWNAHKHELDVSGIAWADLLSLGEQQRLQFCRLFWHHEHVCRHGGTQSFFAVLDESSASMDTTSETCVYQVCVKRKIGILSVAHRPTVIQFHTKVLHFEFDDNHVLNNRIRMAKSMARETASLLTNYIERGPELPPSAFPPGPMTPWSRLEPQDELFLRPL